MINSVRMLACGFDIEIELVDRNQLLDIKAITVRVSVRPSMSHRTKSVMKINLLRTELWLSSWSSALSSPSSSKRRRTVCGRTHFSPNDDTPSPTPNLSLVVVDFVVLARLREKGRLRDTPPETGEVAPSVKPSLSRNDNLFTEDVTRDVIRRSASILFWGDTGRVQKKQI